MIRRISFILLLFVPLWVMADVTDKTSLLANPNFSQGLNGWTHNDACSVADFSSEGFKRPYDVEGYYNSIQLTQTLSNLPNGTYAVTCYVFERPDYNGCYDGKESAVTQLVVNDTSQPVNHILYEPMPEELAQDGVNCNINHIGQLDYYSNKGYVPNDWAGASIAFSAGRYKQTVYGQVTNGQLTIGVTSNGQWVHWVVLGDFHLYYLGDDDTQVAQEKLQKTLDDVSTYQSTYLTCLSTKTKSTFATALSTANTALTSGDADAMDAATALLLTARKNAAFTFKPVSPEEPSVKATTKVTVSCKTADISWQNGEGTYSQGDNAWISTSSYNENYVFQYWMLNGEKYTESQLFTYTVGKTDANFVAVYKYSPVSPADPSAQFRRTLTLQSSPVGVCSFNTASGEHVLVGENMYLCSYGNSSYQFLGWYDEDGNKIGENQDLSYIMPDKNVTLTAKYRYNPTSPDDPSNFYSVSCAFNLVSSDETKGTVSVTGLTDGRAVYGTNITLTMTPTGEGTFYGWYCGTELLSTQSSYTFVATRALKGKTIKAMFSLVGDVDNSGVVTIVDLCCLVSYLNGHTPELFNIDTADVNGDGKVDKSDIDALAELLTGAN